MKHRLVLASVLVFLTVTQLPAQPGPPGGAGGAGLNAGLKKLFGPHTAWLAGVETVINDPRMGNITVPAKMAALNDNTRSEMDASQMKASSIPPAVSAQMKSMGLAETISIVRQDKRVMYIVYPGLKVYLEQALPAEATKSEASYKLDLKETGRETIGGQECVKSDFTLTDDTGDKQQGTVWKAPALKDFPVRIRISQKGTEITMTFSDVTFEKPAVTAFDPPSDHRKVANQQALMQEVMAKQFGAGGIPVPPSPK